MTTMTDFSSVFREDDEILLTKPEITWQLADTAPELLAELAKSEPVVPELCRRLASAVPVQRVWGFGEVGAFTRPDRHVRALYIDLPRVTSKTRGGAVAIKGGEALCTNFDAMVRRLAGMWNVYAWSLGGASRNLFRDPGLISALERFPVIEGKPPGVHPHWDADEEAQCALELQRAYFARYGELARAPVPLLVGRWPASVGDAVIAMLEPHLSPKAVRTVKTEISAGLGVFIYFYPSVPLRVMHIQAPDATNPATLEKRMQVLRSQCQPEVTIERWTEAVSRLLILGYVATDPANLNRGYCVQPQNLCVDGGFVDVNSIRQIQSFKAQGEFKYALTRTVQVLSASISWFLTGTQSGVDAYLQHLPDVYYFVWDALRTKIRTAASAGESLHPWLVDAVASEGLMQDLLRTFRPLIDLGDYRPGDREADNDRVTKKET
jgi:hypothetical protein